MPPRTDDPSPQSSPADRPGRPASGGRGARLAAGTRVEHAMTSGWRGSVEAATGRGFYRVAWDDHQTSEHHGDCLLRLSPDPQSRP
jgi:hypothetical protein